MASSKKRNIASKPVSQVSHKKYWFEAKMYGWGWTPVTIEGWSVVGTYLVVNIANFLRINRTTNTTAETLATWVPEAFILTFFLIYICVKKGENPWWRRGK